MNAVILIVMMHFSCVVLKPTFNCKLPFGCEINEVQFVINQSGKEKTSMEYPGLLCDIRNETFQFDYPIPSALILSYNESCHISTKLSFDLMEFRFPSNFILGKQFNFQKVLNYMSYFLFNVNSNFVNLKGFELDFTIDQNITTNISYYFYFKFQCLRCKIEFYHNGHHIKTCQDILDSFPNSGLIKSLFQIQRGDHDLILAFFHSGFKSTLCPLVFKNSNILSIYLTGLSDTYYKRNILTIENRTFVDLNSTIKDLSIVKAEKINIDSNLLNPSVFQGLTTIFFSGSLNTIDGNSLNALKNLLSIWIEKKNYRDFIHKNGIKWIYDINAGLNVNLSNFEELKKFYYNKKEITVGGFGSNKEMSKVFPDEDFCLYKDYPFNQLVILIEIANNHEVFRILNLTKHYTCSYLWLAQYFNLFLELNK